MVAKLTVCVMSALVAADQEQLVLLQASKPSRPQHKPMIWFHIHKYGGTMMCQKARENNEYFPPDILRAGSNCQIPPDGDFDAEPERQLSCEERIESGYSFSCIERWATEKDLGCADRALMGVSLRDPVKGAMSNIMMHEFDRLYIDRLFDRIFNSSGSELNPRFDADERHWDSAPHVSNYMVRSLAAGEGDYMTGEVTEEHLERAKSTLDKMDVVFILEDLADHGAQLRNILDWHVHTSTEDLPTKVLSTGTDDDKHNFFTDADVLKLRQLNAMDYKFFEYAKKVADMRTQAAEEMTEN